MKLTAGERTRLLDGSYGPLYRKEQPDLDPGTEIVVSWTRPRGWVDEDEQAGTWHAFKPEAERSMWIVVTDVVRRTKGGWSIYYRVVDHRQPDWYMSKDGYTRSKAHSIDTLAVGVDRKTQARLTAEAKQAHEERRMADKEKAEAEARRQAKQVSAHLRDVAVRCARLGIDPTMLIASIEQQLKATERDFKKAA